MDLTKEDYLEAARLIAECKPNKLMYVLAVLRQGGFDVDSMVSNENSYYANYNSKLTLDELRRKKRESRYKDIWINSDDPIVLALRNAYLDGFKVSDISECSGITRTAIYDYMRGSRQYSAFTKERFLNAFESLGINYPPVSEPSIDIFE